MKVEGIKDAKTVMKLAERQVKAAAGDPRYIDKQAAIVEQMIAEKEAVLARDAARKATEEAAKQAADAAKRAEAKALADAAAKAEAEAVAKREALRKLCARTGGTILLAGGMLYLSTYAPKPPTGSVQPLSGGGGKGGTDPLVIPPNSILIGRVNTKGGTLETWRTPDGRRIEIERK